ncbi:hypothetical protein AB9E13_34885, partial [Rhizobium leguminosarum]
FTLLILPLMLPSIFLALMLLMMDAFRVFDSVFVTTGGGPNYATNTLMVLAVKEGLQFFNVGCHDGDEQHGDVADRRSVADV